MVYRDPILNPLNQLQVMKKVHVFTSLFIICWAISFIPYIIGVKEYAKANSTIEYLSSRPENDCSDACIEEVLYYYGFDLGWEESPSFRNYYNVGLKKVGIF